MTEIQRPVVADAETWIFDLDNTLYPFTAAMLAQNNELMSGFIAELLGVDEEEARRVQKTYFRRYGLTVRGLILHHGLDPAVYMKHMAQIDLSEIVPNPRLAGLIERLDGRKIVYTNAFARHTEAVLERLGMSAHFDAIHHIEIAGFIPKPDRAALTDLCRRHGIEACRAVMVEDVHHNLVPAAAAGMTTVWLRTAADWAAGGDEADYIHHRIDDLADWLEQILPPTKPQRRKDAEERL